MRVARAGRAGRVTAGLVISDEEKVRLLGFCFRGWNLGDAKVGVEGHLGVGMRTRITTRISLRFPASFESLIDAMMRDG